MQTKILVCSSWNNTVLDDFFMYNVLMSQVATQPSSFHVAQAAAPPVSTIPTVALSQTQPAKVIYLFLF